MTAEQLEIFKAHVAKTGAGTACPCCGTDSAQAEGPFALGSVDLCVDQQQRLTVFPRVDGVLFPCVVITCKHCFHVRLFAWLPIYGAAEATPAVEPPR